MNLESKLFIQLNMYCTSTVEAVMKDITMIIPYVNTLTLAIKIESIINKYFINQRLSKIKYTYPQKHNTSFLYTREEMSFSVGIDSVEGQEKGRTESFVEIFS